MDKAGRISRRRFVASALSAGAMALLPAHTTASTTTSTPGGSKMPTLTPYLLFDGTCEKAMEFYRSCFGGELTKLRVKDSPAKDSMPEFQHEKTLNAYLKSGSIEFSASDWLMPDRERVRGNTVCLYLNAENHEQLKTLFEKLSEGGQVTDPLTERFFGSYGALNDKFGVRWMFHSNQAS